MVRKPVTGSNITQDPLEARHPWPKAVTVAFLVVSFASFMSWGKIDTHYTWQFMANLEHPGLCNHIRTDLDLSETPIGASLHATGSAWDSGFLIFDIFFPHWLLTVTAGFLFFSAVAHHLEWGTVNPAILQGLSFYGVIHVISSALGFFSQGSSGWGLILTGLGYGIFLIIFLGWK